MEPTIEHYNPDILLDYLAIKFHRQRGYTEGWLPAIQQLEVEGRAEIIAAKRPFFGSTMMEGYSYVVWRPI